MRRLKSTGVSLMRTRSSSLLSTLSMSFSEVAQLTSRVTSGYTFLNLDSRAGISIL